MAVDNNEIVVLSSRPQFAAERDNQCGICRTLATGVSARSQATSNVLGFLMHGAPAEPSGTHLDDQTLIFVSQLDDSGDISRDLLERWVDSVADSGAQASWVLAHYPSTVGSGEVLQLVTWLRSELMWDGGFIAVVPKPAMQERLLNTCFFGQTAKTFRFGSVAGHAAITEPILLSNVVNAMGTVGSMSADCWFDLVRCSTLGGVRDFLQKATAAIDSGDLTAACAQAEGALDAVRGANLATILDHQKWNTAKRLLERVPDPLPVTVPGVRSALLVVDKIESLIFGRGIE